MSGLSWDKIKHILKIITILIKQADHCTSNESHCKKLTGWLNKGFSDI